MGLELERRGFAYTTRLWSGEAVIRRPDLLREIHRAFLAAGATVIETATYQLSHASLRELGYDAAAIDGVFARAVALVREAIAEHRAASAASGAADVEPLLVAGSMGPYGATLGDGSEYSGVEHLDRAALAAFHSERLGAIARARPDVFLFETIPTGTEALVVAEVAREAAAGPAWISLSSADGRHAYDGADICDVAAALDAFANVEAIGVNCVAPGAAVRALRSVARGTAKPVLICANLGQHWDGGAHGLTGGGSADDFLNATDELLALGARYIGGCCGVGPETIARLAARVNAANAHSLLF